MNQGFRIGWLAIAVLLGIAFEFLVSSYFLYFFIIIIEFFLIGLLVFMLGLKPEDAAPIVAFPVWLALQFGIVIGFSFFARTIAVYPHKRLAFRVVLIAGIAITVIEGLWYWGLLPLPLWGMWMDLIRRLETGW